MPPATEAGAHAIVLAAGAARRFGGGKLCSELNGRPLVAWSVGAALATRVESVTVVVGADAARVRMAVSGFDDPRLRTLSCPEWSEGLSASLRCGIESLPDSASALLIFLGDMPHVSSGLADELLDRVLGRAPAAMPTWQGRPGHPVAIAAELFPKLKSLTGDAGAGRLLRSLPDVVRVETPDRGAVIDIDTAADLQERKP